MFAEVIELITGIRIEPGARGALPVHGVTKRTLCGQCDNAMFLAVNADGANIEADIFGCTGSIMVLCN